LFLITHLLVCISEQHQFSGGIAADILGRNSDLYRQVPGNILQIINLSVLVILVDLLLFIAIRESKPISLLFITSNLWRVYPRSPDYYI